MTADTDALRLVPVEPTEAMLQGGCSKHKPGEPMSDKWHEECPSFVSRRKIWADMIAAAPVSPDSDLLKEAVGVLKDVQRCTQGPSLDARISAFLSKVEERGHD